MAAAAAAVTVAGSYAPPVGGMVDPVQQHIKAYIEARDAYNKAGGQEFIADRRDVRGAYVKAQVPKEAIKKWVGDLPTKGLQETFTRRFEEWNNKISKGVKMEAAPAPTAEGAAKAAASASAAAAAPTAEKTASASQAAAAAFFLRLQAHYIQYKEFLESPVLAAFTKANDELKADILPLLKNLSVDAVVTYLGITDEELISRIRTEWSWKAQ